MARALTKFPQNDIISLTLKNADYDLAESVGPDLRLGDLAGGDLGALADLPLAYGTPAGRLDLRQAIAALHDVAADDVVVTVGGMHGLFLIAAILCQPGDEAVLTSPCFPNTRAVLDAAGAEVKTLRLSFDDGYRLTPDALREQLSPRTRLVCLTSPHNPSGVITPTQTIAAITRMMHEICPEAFLLLDETYREAVYGNAAIAPSPVYLGPKIISCASLSKCHGAPGLRLGWVITRDPALRQQLILGKFNTVISCSAIDEALGICVLQQRDKILKDRREHLAEGFATVANWVAMEHERVEWVRPAAGALCCIRLRPSAFDIAAAGRLHEELAREGVRVACGTWFGDEPGVFRLGFGLLAMPDLERALGLMSAALRRL